MWRGLGAQTAMSETRLRLMPGEAFELLIYEGYHQLQLLGYSEFGHIKPLTYPTGMILSQWLATRGIHCDNTPPGLIPQAIWAVLFPSEFADWHLLSDELTYALNLAWREAGSPGVLAREVLCRRRSRIFRLWRRCQRQAVWVQQRLFHERGV